MKKIAIVMGSQSDLPIIQPAIALLEEFQAPFMVRVLSAHRTPHALHEFVLQAPQNDIGVFIAAAGKSAHLAGVIASLSILPVIALPILTQDLGGLDSLLSSVQMPSGVPVACVGINAAQNAALLALEILALHEAALAEKLQQARHDNEAKILQADRALSSQFHKEPHA
ncbi:5-(carboxyamino)imidazole ribonucleotide mutase [Helicobacter labacensis]|uniref:5-(carboxyamino)imidazole ribonucleotide mutase n=1 Tax=Helicobacter labacensis TaxID=2316079 RepID=UPI000EAF8F0C|nr:5-(carboxyamino)imidazole ribonucleotide mutase [Helicobacter labacensis]